jgi:peptidoglycan/LPS O-acetylase OafA/YrhL
MTIKTTKDIVQTSKIVDSIVKVPRPNNFDFLRFILAFSIVLGHLPITLPLVFIPFGAISVFSVRCFFVISGFLIVMSYENSRSLKTYLINRIRRIYPAYFFVVIASAFGFSFISSLSWSEYFAHPNLFKYIAYNLVFLNTVQPTLPGVFEKLADSTINGPLWTIKIEVMFYVLVPLLVILFKRFNKAMIISIIYILSFLYFLVCTFIYQKTGSHNWEQLSRQLPGQLSFFVSGTLIYYYFDAFKKYSRILTILAVALVIIQINLPGGDFLKPTANLTSPINIAINLFLPISLGVIMSFIAFYTRYLHLFIKYGDLSYGIYIFHYPIVKLFANFELYTKHSNIAVGLTVCLALLIAYCSWNLLEKPFLAKTNYYKLQALQ